MEEQNTKKKVKGMKFYKKVWYSIFKLDEYDDMIAEGAKKALNYLYVIVGICAVIFTIFQVFYISKTYEKCANFVNDSIPELSYTEGTLNVNSNDIIEIENEILNNVMGGKLIINMSDDFDETLETYNMFLQNETSTIILLKNKFITINYKGDNTINSYDYNQSLDSYLLNNGQPTQFNKQDLINYFRNVNYATYIIEYFIVYFVSYLIVFLIFILIAMILGFICSKILKMKITIKQLFSLSVYAYTLSMIIIIAYSVLNVFANISIKYIQLAYMLIAYIYIVTILINKKNKMKEFENI